MPDSDQPYRLAVHWDFSAAAKDRHGLSTVGFGDARSADAAPIEELQSTYFMGGLLHRHPEVPASSGFMAAWQGTPPFDAKPLMTWTESLYGYYLKFFQAPMGSPYAVFMRRNLINAGGGVGIRNSFVVTFGADTDPADLKGTLAHEMLHTFVGHLDGPDSFAGSWFSEGLAVYYERLLPFRAGSITSADYLRDINTTAARYFTNALNHTPNDQIGARFWADTRVRVLPYDRGGLYFAVVNDEVRKASHGKRSLDDLVLEMLEGRRAGHPMTEDTWRRIVARELGENGAKQFDAMLAGELIVPASDSFGACYERTTARLRRYELGFTPDVLAEPARIVRGLIPGSAAARAGLRDGDHIVKPVPQDKIQADQQAMLHLQVQRAGRIVEISYLPRGETVDAYQWQAKPGCSENHEKPDA
jgi:predicted metalloprotease with PDZ domain